MSFEITGLFSLTACPTRPRPPVPVSVSARGAVSKNPRTSPSQATGFTCMASRSTTPTQAMRNCPAPTAMRQASRNSSSRLRTRTIAELIPLSTAWTRLSRVSFRSCSRRSVTSREITSIRATLPAASPAKRPRPWIHRTSPPGYTIRYSASNVSPSAAFCHRVIIRCRSSGWISSPHSVRFS